MSSEIRLNPLFVKTRLAELGLKQWWLAEQIGVDRKTIARWLNGQVKSVQIDNARALARVLTCSLEDLQLREEGEHIATAEDQRIAATLLATSSMLDKLGPTGEWDVIESLLKATILPNLPLTVLGQLYNQLTVASWRQSKIDAAALYNLKALAIARQCGEQSLLASALLSTANIHSWRGEVPAAITAYTSCLNLIPEDEIRRRAAVHSNLGAVLFEAGDLANGEAQIQLALSLFQKNGTPMNRSIAFTHLARLQLERGEVVAALTSVNSAQAEAQQDDYKRGLHMSKLLRAELAALQGESAALQLLEVALSGFSELGIEEGLNYEIAGRICRLLGDRQASEKYLRHGLILAKNFPVYLAALYHELALTADDERAALESERLYIQCGCPLRAALCRNVP